MKSIKRPRDRPEVSGNEKVQMARRFEERLARIAKIVTLFTHNFKKTMIF